MTDANDNLPNLRTSRLVLRAPNEHDIPTWFSRATDREAAELAGDRIPADITVGEDWLNQSLRRSASGIRLQWAVDAIGLAPGVGTVSLSMKEPELSFVFGRQYWGQGLATEAAHEVLVYAFGPLCLPEVTAEVVSRNTPSLRVLEKLGFQKTGTFVDEADGEVCEKHVVAANHFRTVTHSLNANICLDQPSCSFVPQS